MSELPKSNVTDQSNLKGQDNLNELPPVFNIFATDFLKPCALQKYELIQYIHKFSAQLKSSKKEFEKYYLDSIKLKQLSDSQGKKLKEINEEHDKCKSTISYFEKKIAYISAENMHLRNVNNDLSKQIQELKNCESGLAQYKKESDTIKLQLQSVQKELKDLKQEKDILTKNNIINVKKIEKFVKAMEESKKMISTLKEQNNKFDEEKDKFTKAISDFEKKNSFLSDEKNELTKQKALLEKTVNMLKRKNSGKNLPENSSFGLPNQSVSVSVQVEIESGKERKTKVNLKKIDTPKPQTNYFDFDSKFHIGEKLSDNKSIKVATELTHENDNLRSKFDEVQKQLTLKNEAVNNLNIFIKSLELKVIYLTKENIELRQRRENAKAEIKELYKRSPSANSATSNRSQQSESVDKNKGQISVLRSELERLYKEYVVNTFTNDCRGMTSEEKSISIKIEKKLNSLLSDLRDINDDALKGILKCQNNVEPRKSIEKTKVIPSESTKLSSIKKEQGSLNPNSLINLANQRLTHTIGSDKFSGYANNNQSKNVTELSLAKSGKK